MAANCRFSVPTLNKSNFMRAKILQITLCILAVAAPAFAEANGELPTQGLEQRVEFWKKVFTQYGKDDVVIHDRIYVNLIYDVASSGDVDSKSRAVRDAIREIRSNLETPQELSPAAQKIYLAIVDQGIPMSAASLDRLAADVHTQLGVKELFRDGVVRSGRYVGQFQQILKSEGVPEELALLPLVESSFQNAKSSAGAIGIWQFTRSTGRLYMRVSGKVDERLDPIKATQGAAKLLRDNQRALGAWPLAITAYNHGRGGMLRAQQEHGSDLSKIINEYDGPLFGYASMNFYSEFLAAVSVYNDYRNYFGELVLDTPGPMPKTLVSPKAAASPVVKTASKTTPAKAKTPVKSAAGEKYKVRSGDTLFEIAQRFGTTIRDLMQKNNLQRPAIYAGQILMVPR
jgi:membrane-bound lytic murein transglycosylase D